VSGARYRLARAFLLAGGHVSWSEWHEMGAEEQAALVLAGDHLRRETSAMAGNAARSGDSAAEIIAPVDGGAELEAAALVRLMREDQA
jgi:hypothetical protein